MSDDKKDKQTSYSCKECGANVYVVDGHLKRECDHAKAPVVLSLSAVAYGLSRVDKG